MNKATAVDPSLRGLDGWLIPWTIGLALTPLSLFLSGSKAWVVVSLADASRIPTLSYLEGVAWLCVCACQVMTAIMFFRRDRRTPYLLTMLVLAQALYYSLASLRAADYHLDGEVIRNSVLAVVLVPAWIAYFHRSARVRATFVE